MKGSGRVTRIAKSVASSEGGQSDAVVQRPSLVVL
jgi:hypothetical protein